MNSNVPRSAAKLLDFIGSAEAPEGYDTLYGNHQGDLPKPLTTMTISAVIAAGPTWLDNYGSTACGRYQFMTTTLKTLTHSEHLSGNELMNADFQDTLGYVLLEHRGFEKFLIGMISRTEFGLGLAKEWASFPVLADCPGAHRPVKRGETYYAGDGKNRPLVTPAQVEAVLTAILNSSITARAEVMFNAPLTNDGSLIGTLVRIGSDPTKCAEIRAKAFQAMTKVYGKPTSHNACACTLSMFLRAAGMNIDVEYGAGRLAEILESERGWQRIKKGAQKPGDVAVTMDLKSPAGADHIFLVIKSYDGDRMLIADNQTSTCPHERYASGHGQTPVDYFLRASSSLAALSAAVRDDKDVDVAMEDEDTNALVIRFTADGKPLDSAAP